MADELDEGKPVRVVAENSEREIAAHRALAAIRFPLRELAANLMRVTRGAGKPWAIVDECAAVLTAIVAYQDVAGEGPSAYDLSQMLSLEPTQGSANPVSDEYDDEFLSESVVVRGALQVAASSLLGQTTQKRAGETEMSAGVRQMEASRTRVRAMRGTPGPKKKTKKKPRR